MENRRFIIVGLGNPDPEYRWNRHNVGFMALDALSERCTARARKKKTRWFEKRDVELDGRALTLVRPLLYMNRSGQALAQMNLDWKKHIVDLIVIYDDKDLSFGSIRLRANGSAGSHNGIKNIIDTFGTTEIKRIRIGIGAPEHSQLRDYVLSDFKPEERKTLDDTLALVSDAIAEIVEGGFVSAMNKFNRKMKPVPEEKS
ncbi:MAG TPA: aminoacyl-tRNA hydrolase [bacterium]|nr:aminoacyl-tRNA hydrolase [bacterium]